MNACIPSTPVIPTIVHCPFFSSPTKISAHISLSSLPPLFILTQKGVPVKEIWPSGSPKPSRASYRIRKSQTLRLKDKMLQKLVHTWGSMSTPVSPSQSPEGRLGHSCFEQGSPWNLLLLLLPSPCPHLPHLSLTQPSIVSLRTTSHRKPSLPGIRAFLFLSYLSYMIYYHIP